MATAKQTRAVMKRIYTYRSKLQQALNDAHELKVIEYENYDEQSPYSTLWETKDRIDATTQKALAKTMKNEIMAGIK